MVKKARNELNIRYRRAIIVAGLMNSIKEDVAPWSCDVNTLNVTLNTVYS